MTSENPTVDANELTSFDPRTGHHRCSGLRLREMLPCTVTKNAVLGKAACLRLCKKGSLCGEYTGYLSIEGYVCHAVQVWDGMAVENDLHRLCMNTIEIQSIWGYSTYKDRQSIPRRRDFQRGRSFPLCCLSPDFKAA